MPLDVRCGSAPGGGVPLRYLIPTGMMIAPGGVTGSILVGGVAWGRGGMVGGVSSPRRRSSGGVEKRPEGVAVGEGALPGRLGGADPPPPLTAVNPGGSLLINVLVSSVVEVSPITAWKDFSVLLLFIFHCHVIVVTFVVVVVPGFEVFSVAFMHLELTP